MIGLDHILTLNMCIHRDPWVCTSCCVSPDLSWIITSRVHLPPHTQSHPHTHIHTSLELIAKRSRVESAASFKLSHSSSPISMPLVPASVSSVCMYGRKVRHPNFKFHSKYKKTAVWWIVCFRFSCSRGAFFVRCVDFCCCFSHLPQN